MLAGNKRKYVRRALTINYFSSYRLCHIFFLNFWIKKNLRKQLKSVILKHQVVFVFICLG